MRNAASIFYHSRLWTAFWNETIHLKHKTNLLSSDDWPMFWFHGLSDHLMFLFCSTNGFVYMVIHSFHSAAPKAFAKLNWHLFTKWADLWRQHQSVIVSSVQIMWHKPRCQRQMSWCWTRTYLHQPAKTPPLYAQMINNPTLNRIDFHVSV